ncbi:hypothetical protein ACFVL4_21245 [Bacillus subtilis]|nr:MULTISPECIES: hypothetical protein [Bacillus subtilis group]AVB12031.1 hypothetical protein C3438_21455 [Bacillus velezensis]MCT6515413.1 hypothetical protein [Bacillus subtilis]MDK7657014.1 hypothetical protein [Bacillus subtilis]MEC0407602.1 hypothetical protein [Bacillus subtilis]MEC0419519.1 hypothetical protein [Bacillus subtilis]
MTNMRKLDIIEKLKYAHRFAKRDELYDSNFVEEALLSEDGVEEALKYAHRFAKRDNTYDSEYVQSTIKNGSL